MRRRAELGGIGSGVLQSFVSRNNDLDGYWALGKLYLYSKRVGSKVIRLNLIAGDIDPPVQSLAWWHAKPDLAKITAKYHMMLISILARRKVPKHWLASAIVTLEFESDNAVPRYVKFGGAAKPFLCTLTLTDDLGRMRDFRFHGWCGPHNPFAEHRSARALEYLHDISPNLHP